MGDHLSGENGEGAAAAGANVRTRRRTLVLCLVGAGLLVASFLSPEGRKALERYQCEQRSLAKTKEYDKVLGKLPDKEKVARAQVREFLKANFPSLRVVESGGMISADMMQFSFDEEGFMTRILYEIPCPMD